MSIPIITCELLKQLRKNSGITQKKLAEEVNLTQGYIARIERGTSDPKLSVINRILKYLQGLDQAIIAKDIMTPEEELIIGHPENVIIDLTEKMLKAGFSQIPILNSEGFCVGTLQESDLLVLSMRNPNLKHSSVKDVMTPPLPTFNENTPIDIIEKILENLPAVLITDNKGRTVGIITRSNILESF